MTTQIVCVGISLVVIVHQLTAKDLKQTSICCFDRFLFTLMSGKFVEETPSVPIPHSPCFGRVAMFLSSDNLLKNRCNNYEMTEPKGLRAAECLFSYRIPQIKRFIIPKNV